MKPSILSPVIAAAVLLGVLPLAGCSAVSMPVDSPTGSAPAPSASTSATNDLNAFPSPRVPMACDDIASLATVTEVTGLGNVELVDPLDPSSASASGSPLAGVAMERIGALVCEWRSADQGTDMLNSSLSVQVVADPPQETRDGVAALWASPDPIQCDGAICGAVAWSDRLGITISFPSTSVIDDQRRSDWAQSVIDRVLALPAPAPLWTPPGAASSHPSSCEEATPAATVAQQTGSAAEEVEFTGPSTQLGLLSAPRYLVGQLDCYWTGAEVSLVPGGAWAIDAVRQRLNGSASATAGDGVTWSVGSGAGGHRTVVASRGSDIVLVSIPGNASDEALVKLATAALSGSA